MDIKRVKNRMDYGVMRSQSTRTSGCSSCGADQLRARGWKKDDYEDDEEHMEQSAVSMSGPTVKSDKLELTQVVTPGTSVPPGGPFTVQMYVINRASVIVNDPDGCNSLAGNGCSGQDGFCLRVFADFQGQSDEYLHCSNLPFTGAGSNTDVLDFEFQAPETPGEYTVSVGFETTNSEMRAGPVSGTITVAEDEPVTEPPGDGGGTPGGDGPDQDPPGGGGGTPGDSLVSAADRQLIIFVVAALLALRGLSFISGE